MSNYSVYFSPTGGTKKVIDIFKDELVCEKEIDLTVETNQYNQYIFSDKDVCIFAVPSFGGRVPNIAAERIGNMHGNGAKAILIAVFGNRAIDDTLIEMKDILESSGFVCIAAVEAVAEHSIMHQFAAGRPDDDDKQELQAFAQQIVKDIKLKEHYNLLVPGNKPYKTYNGIPLKPSADKHCIKCGICAKLCPVGAIHKENPKKTDNSKCISCMRCIGICPEHARNVNAALVKVSIAKLKKACEERKENKLYI